MDDNRDPDDPALDDPDRELDWWDHQPDHLRAECNRGRVVRVGRGRYRAGRIPGSTRRRIRTRARRRWREAAVARERQLLAEAARGEQPRT